MVKLFENTFRSVNIALVNELAIMCRRLGMSVWEVIDAAATKPFGFMPFYPGPGHRRPLPAERPALPVVARRGSPATRPRFITFADEINGGMPALHRAARRPTRSTTRAKAVKGSRILALGVAYKRGRRGHPRFARARDHRGPPRRAARSVDYADPHVPQLQVGGQPPQSVAWAQRRSRPSYDLVVLLTAHPEFEPARLVRDARLVLDTRNATGALGDFRHVIKI